MRLDVGVLRFEERLGSLDRQRLDPVHVDAAAVVALARIALRVLVIEERPERLEHGRAGDVLRRDQLQRVLLAFELLADRVSHLGIDRIDLAGEVARLQHGLHYERRSSASEIEPGRSTRSAAPLRSTIVEGRPIGTGPPSRTRSTSGPRAAWAASASSGGGAPARLALLLATGSARARRSRAAAASVWASSAGHLSLIYPSRTSTARHRPDRSRRTSTEAAGKARLARVRTLAA